MTNNEIATMIGVKYYRYKDPKDPDSLEVKRVVGVQNSETVKVVDENGVMSKLRPEYIKDHFRAIVPHGAVSIHITTVDTDIVHNDDVVVMLFKYNDIERCYPFAVCRQCIVDVMHNFNNALQLVYAGCSVNRMSIPDNLILPGTEEPATAEQVFDFMRTGRDFRNAVMISVYMDDSLDDILRMVKCKEYDKVLEESQARYCRAQQLNIPKKGHIHGYCNSLRMLLEQNDFMYDFNSCFNISKFNIKINGHEDEDGLIICDAETVATLRVALRQELTKATAALFDYYIDLDKIKMNYALVKDITDTLYIIGYFSDGMVPLPDVAEEYKKIISINNTKYEDELSPDEMLSKILEEKRK